jgi:chemotaxis protein methyltransferase CheR
MTAVSDADFRRYQRIVFEEAGIRLGDTKRALLEGRLARRLRELELTSYSAYLERVRSDARERVRMLDLLVTNETSFFRESAQFAFLEQTLVPMWIAEAAAGKRPASLRVWSAGCATGEEPYSVAMLLHSLLDGWAISILATDLSTSALERAAVGIFPIARASAIPEDLLRRYVLRGIGDRAGVMKIGPEVRPLVEFRRGNLHDPTDVPEVQFDVVLCRNVLIYFDAEARRNAFDRLIAACRPGGHLFVGHAETLQGCPGVRVVQPTIWRRAA